MTGNSGVTAPSSVDRPIRSDLTKVDHYELTAGDYDDIPELTDEMIARAEIHAEDGSTRCSPLGVVRNFVPVDLLPAIVDHFRAKGPGWEARINEALMVIVDRETRSKPNS